MTTEVRWFVMKNGKVIAGPFRDLYAAYRKAQQKKGCELVKQLSITKG